MSRTNVDQGTVEPHALRLGRLGGCPIAVLPTVVRIVLHFKPTGCMANFTFVVCRAETQAKVSFHQFLSSGVKD